MSNKFLFNGKERQELTNWDDYGARMYMADIGRWNVVDPSSDKYGAWSPFSYVFNNPLILVDPDGADPIDPRTGEEYAVDLWKSGVYTVNRSRNNPDRSLLSRITRPFPLNNYPRTIDSSSGTWAEGEDLIPRRDRAYDLTTQKSIGFIQKNSNPNGTEFDYPVAPNDYMWTLAATSGTYTFFDNVQAEGAFYLDHDSYNVISVKDNYIDQVINLQRNEDGKFELNSVTKFDTKVGEVQTETKKTIFGTKTTKYKTLTVTETTYTFKNGEIQENTKTYERRQKEK